MIMKKPKEAMIGNNGKVDGSIEKMLLQMNNGKKIDKDCSKKMEMDGGGFKKKGRKINERNTII
jgi:hypothetical protein|tara:strand:+ start:122 stop:313 length:192 start_codon:yes stop_codon:yes gene_type:complete